MKKRLTESNILECQAKFNLSYHVSYAHLCEQLIGLEGKDVLEVGGSLPKDFVFDYLNVKSWSAIETPDYEASLKEVGGLSHKGTILGELDQRSRLDFRDRELDKYNFFLANIEDLPPDYYQKYDLIFSIAAFEHIHKLPASLEKMFLALKPEGQFFTMFAPIWSAHDGHHLPQIYDKKGNAFEFHNSPIPPWGHLLMTPPELCNYLYQITDKETANQIVYYIYNSNHINRFFAEDYIEFIHQSAFTVKKIDPVFLSRIDEETQKSLERLYPGRTQFANNGFLIVLEKSLKSKALQKDKESVSSLQETNSKLEVVSRDAKKHTNLPLSLSRLSELVDRYQEDPADKSTLFDLLQYREQVTAFWLDAAKVQLESAYLSDVGKAHKVLMSSGIKDELLTDSEQNYADELAACISKGLNEPEAIHYLIAAMLYFRADQLPLQPNFTQIPKWFLDDYLKFIFSSPRLFKRIGEVDNYYYYMRQLVSYLHSSILDSPESSFWQDIALFFTQNSNFVPLYFNINSLVNLYAKRAEIIEFNLKNQGYQVNYDFPQRSLGRKRIRLGILAAHFGPQTETFATLPMYKYLSRDIFEIVLYTLKVNNHRLERYCAGHADAFINLPQDLASQVQTIRDGDLDILFIGTNITAVTNPIALLALHRLARIQATSVCSCVTTGMRNVDFYISGQLTEPEDGAQQLYTETLLTLEGPAHCYDFATEEQLLTTITVSRESLGINKDTIVYISGANFHKITPEVEQAWMKIISSVPNSRLILYPFNPNWSSSYPTFTFKKRLASACTRYGLSESRVIILEPVQNLSDAKERLKLGNVYLDSYPFSGVTSLLDPLEIGLPVVLMDGNSFRSRMGPAFLRELHIPELIADSEKAYVQLAIALGTNPKLRKQKSDQIKQRMQANPRFLDSRAYSAQVGAIFQEVFRKYQEDALKENFKLRKINLIAFPDWSRTEDLLYQDLASAIRIVATHPDKTNVTLLVDTSNISEEDANLALADVVMFLLLEEDLDVTDGPEVSLIGELSELQWEALLPCIQARIVLEHANEQAIAAANAVNLPLLQLLT